MWRTSVVVLWLVACGGGDDTWQPSSSEVGACRAFLTATCNQIARCSPAFFEAFEGDLERCVDARVETCTKQFLPGSKTTASDVSGCAADVDAASCEQAIRYITMQADLCERVPGERSDGEACDADAQCASTYCDNESVGACGVCVPPPGIGTSCVDGDTCSAGQACVQGGCIPLFEAGATCGPTARCFADLQCSVSRICEATLALGATCDPFQALNPCGFANFCNEKTFVCERQRAGATEACGRTADGSLALCAPGMACKLSGSSGTCVPAGSAGESCAGAFRGPPCAIGLACEDGVCVAPQPLAGALRCE